VPEEDKEAEVASRSDDNNDDLALPVIADGF